MWLIPGKTKVRLEIFKGISLFDILIGIVGVGSIILTIMSNFTNKLVIVAVLLAVFALLLIRVDETPNYELFLCVLRYAFSNKSYAKRMAGKKSQGKDIKDLCAFTGIEKNVIRYGSNYYGAAIEIPSIEFRLFSKTRKNTAIVSGVGSIIRNMNPSCGINIVKLERPIHYEKYHEAEVAKLEELRKAYEMGSLTEDELKARVDIIYGRLEELNHMMGDRKVIVPFYYIVLFDSDIRQLENQVRSAMNSLKNAEMTPKRLDNKELAIFLKYSNEGTFDESEIDQLAEKDYAAWAMPKSVKFRSTKVEINDIITHESQITDYPLMESDAWLATVMTIPATKVVVKCTGMDMGRAVKDIDKSLFELRGQIRQTSVQSKLIELNQHAESLNSLLVKLKGENEVLVKTNVYVTGYDVVLTEKMGRKEVAKASIVPRISNMKHTVKRIFSEQNLKIGSPMFEQFNLFVGSQISSYDPFMKSGRSMPGNSVAACFPWVFARVEDERGVKLGSTDHVPVFIDFFRRDSERVNSNLVIVGKSGSGKSYATKSILANLAADNVKIFVLDPENEYTELAGNLHGKFINVANAQHGRLNPFHVITTLEDGDSEFAAESDGVSGSYSTHLQFLEEFFKQIMPDCDKDSLEYLNTIVDRMYLERGITAETNLLKLKPEDYPTFDTLYDAVLSEFQRTENDYIRTMLRTIMNYISKFASGGRNASIWNGPSSVTTDENFTVFNFQTLLANRNATIANAQMLLVLKYIDNEIIKNREYNKRYNMNRKIAVVIDEAHVFIDTKFPIALDFMFQLAKRIRKYNGMQIVITQNIKDFVGSEDIARKSTAIINASQYSLIFALAPNDLDDLCKLYEKSGGINEVEQEKIGTAPRGLAFSVLSPMHRSRFQVETTKDMVSLFNHADYESPYFVGKGGKENWEDYMGDSKAKRAEYFLSKADEEEEEESAAPVTSHVHFDEISGDEALELLSEREEQENNLMNQKQVEAEPLFNDFKQPEAPVFEQPQQKVIVETVQVQSEQNNEDRMLMLKLLEQMSAENINLKIREQVSALMESVKTLTPAAPEVPVAKPQVVEEAVEETEEIAEETSTAIGKIEPVKMAVDAKTGEPLGIVSDENEETNDDVFAFDFDEDQNEDQDEDRDEDQDEDQNEDQDEDLLDIMSLLNDEANKMDEISTIEQMELFDEQYIEISLDDLQLFVMNRKVKAQ